MGAYEEPKEQQTHYERPWIETPLIESTSLSKIAGCRIFLKLENLQPSGSFKSRAIGNLVRSHVIDPANKGKKLHFFIASAGNAGLGAACAANLYSFPCTVAVPANTKPVMVKKLEDNGARVVKAGNNLNEASVYMRQIMKELSQYGSEDCVANGSTPNGIQKCGCCGNMTNGSKPSEIVPIELHPFDREQIWEGVSTIADELAYQLPPPDEDMQHGPKKYLPADAIICSVGGGGLMNGIIEGIERQSSMYPKRGNQNHNSTNGNSNHDENIHIVAVETVGTDSLAASIENGALTSLPAITSMASSLGVLCVAEKTFQNAVSPPPGVKVHSIVLTDADAARGVLHIADEHKMLVELACGVAAEVALGRPKAAKATAKSNGQTNGITRSYLEQMIPNFGPESRVVVVVCGGSNISLEMAMEWRQRLADGWGAGDDSLQV
ncbi:hypothetical protein FQN57_000978 [Myotisia sp. PD_48]|nr:hypothetical protein FQN57_000978 [Myotisia sp. PD_48]